ncbi:MAG: hypothetical protein HY823_01000 [Acidobacteria bacterium]|nr:hypothetical protein [Acidobacteriota bacterium]
MRSRGPFVCRQLRRIVPGGLSLNRVGITLRSLLRASEGEDPLALARGLQLLAEALGAAGAILVTVEGSNFETRWWWPDQGEAEGPEPVAEWCRWLSEHPHRILQLREDSRDRQDGDAWAPGIRGAAGMALWRRDRPQAFVFAHFREPRRLGPMDLAALDAVAAFMGRVLEVEGMKVSMARLEEALALTRAVMEDSGIEDPVTELPNLRYLDLWLKAKISAGVPHREQLTVAQFRLPLDDPANVERIRRLAQRVRGGDLLVAEGPGRFLLLLRRINKAMGNLYLGHLAQILGQIPLGATLWIPGKDDPGLESVRRRLEQALDASRAREGHGLVWELPEGAEDGAGEPEGAEPEESPGGLRPWRPRRLGPAGPEVEPRPQESPRPIHWPRLKPTRS